MNRNSWGAIGFVWLLVVAAPSLGQSPYVGLEGRPVKALSEQQIEDYLAGNGMGFALAAELNGFPGPKHVLELEAELGLTEAQSEAVERAFQAMAKEARRLGEMIVGLERELDTAFAAGTVERDRLLEATEEIGRLNGALRGVHLVAHLETVEILTAEQRHLYMQARGYGESMVHDPSRHHRQDGS